jgi:hypothetical protein
MNLDANLNKEIVLKPGWPVFELYDENDNFLNIVELIPDGFVGISRTDTMHQWKIDYDTLYFYDNFNTISMTGKLLDEEKYIFLVEEVSSKKNYFLKYIHT